MVTPVKRAEYHIIYMAFAVVIGEDSGSRPLLEAEFK
jgi:hypothetical protein